MVDTNLLKIADLKEIKIDFREIVITDTKWSIPNVTESFKKIDFVGK